MVRAFHGESGIIPGNSEYDEIEHNPVRAIVISSMVAIIDRLLFPSLGILEREQPTI